MRGPELDDEPRAPPHSIEAEQSVLGGLMLDNGSWPKVEAILHAESFYSSAHQDIFTAMRELLVAGAPVDVAILADALRAAGKLEYVGGMSYLGALVENVPTARNIGHYAEIVRGHAIRRQLAAVGRDIAAAAFAQASDVVPATLLDDARERLDALTVADRRPGRLQFLSVGQVLLLHGSEWRIVKLIPGRGVVVIYGATGAGKTFLASDLAAAITHRQQWFGHRVKRGPVAYLAAEGHLRHRLKAYVTEHPDADLTRLRVLQAPLDLRDPKADLAPLLGQLRALAVELGGIAAVVVDTLNAVMVGGDENTSEAMGAVIAAARKIAEAVGCVTILIHHSGKDPDRGPRGFSGLTAAVDCQILVTNRDGVRCAEVEKLRDGESGERLCFRLKAHSWPSEDPEAEAGDLDSSCTVQPVDPTGFPAETKPPKLPKGTTIALQALREAITEHGQPLPASSVCPAGIKAVAGELWRGRYYTLDPATPDDDSPAAIKRADQSRRKRFERARAALQDAKVVEGRNDSWWIW